MATPQLLSRKANGHASPAASQSASDHAPKQSRGKAPAEGEKVTVRRLPPGMTAEEFLTILGDEWKVGKGKVAWFDYRNGKVSSDPAKPSRPAVAYLLVLKHEELVHLDEAVRTSAWRDAKETWDNPSLIGPPVLELAMYKKVPSAKRRTDTRQGTIDQDPEYMAFLASLTNPEGAPKDADGETEDNGKPEKATSTPLIDYLREKKANRAKETQAAKSNARHARQESSGKAKATAQTPEDGKKKNDGRLQQPREKVKILTKKATEAAAEAAKNAAAQIQSVAGTQSQSHSRAQGQEAPVKSRRADVTAMARILQRDLGLSPGNAHRQARRDAAAKAAAEARAAEKADKAEKPPQSAASPMPAPPAPTTARPNTPTAPKATQQQAPASTPPQPASTGRTRNRRRGGGGDDKGKGEKASEPTSAAPEKPPVVLLRKKEESTNSTQSAAPAAPSPTTAKPPPAGPKAATAAAAQKQPAARDQRRGQQQAPQQASAPSAAAAPTRAFIKHANPSQGVTEALLKQALAAFGSVVSVEIDRRRGVAYATFEQPDGLAKAISASPVPVPETEAKIAIAVRKDKEDKGKKAPASKASTGEKTPAAASASTPAPAPAATTEPATPTQRGKGGGDKAPGPSAASSVPGGEGEKADGQKRSTRRGRRGRGGGGGDRKKEDAPVGAATSAGGGGAAPKENAAGGGSGKKAGGGDSQAASQVERITALIGTLQP